MRYSLTYDKENSVFSIDIPVEEILYTATKSSVLSPEQIREILKNPAHFIRQIMDTLQSGGMDDTLIEQMIEQAASQAIGDEV